MVRHQLKTASPILANPKSNQIQLGPLKKVLMLCTIIIATIASTPTTKKSDNTNPTTNYIIAMQPTTTAVAQWNKNTTSNKETTHPRSETSKRPRKKQKRERSRTAEINLANHKQPRLDEFGIDIYDAVEVYHQSYNKGDVFTSPPLASAGANRKSRTVSNSRWATPRGIGFLTPGKQWQRNPSRGPTDIFPNSILFPPNKKSPPQQKTNLPSPSHVPTKLTSILSPEHSKYFSDNNKAGPSDSEGPGPARRHITAMAEKARAPPHYTGPQSCVTPPTRLKSRATTTRDTPPRREKRGLLYQLPSSNPHKNRIAPTTTKKTNSITKPKHVGPLKHSRYDKGELQKGKPVKIHKKKILQISQP